VNFFLHPLKPSWLYSADNPEPSLHSVVYYLDKDIIYINIFFAPSPWNKVRVIIIITYGTYQLGGTTKAGEVILPVFIINPFDRRYPSELDHQPLFCFSKLIHPQQPTQLRYWYCLSIFADTDDNNYIVVAERKQRPIEGSYERGEADASCQI